MYTAYITDTHISIDKITNDINIYKRLTSVVIVTITQPISSVIK